MGASPAPLEHGRAPAAKPTLRRRGGVFLFDSKWRWVAGNDAASRMVVAGWWRGKLMASLEACHAATRDAWLAVQREMLDGKASPTVIAVRDAQGKLLAFASAHEYGVVPEPSRRYVLYVRPLQWADTDVLGGQLEQLLGLTAAESRFAIALRRLGDIGQAAAAVGIAESSARTRLQSIFDKIDVHRLSSLLLLIDALAEMVA